MKDFKKTQKQWAEMEFAHNKLMFIDNKVKSAKGSQVKSEKDKLLEEKKDLLLRLEQKKYKYAKNERQKEQFRTILFKNFSQQPTVDYEIPVNLPNLYYDAIEDKNFTK